MQITKGPNIIDIESLHNNLDLTKAERDNVRKSCVKAVDDALLELGGIIDNLAAEPSKQNKSMVKKYEKEYTKLAEFKWKIEGSKIDSVKDAEKLRKKTETILNKTLSRHENLNGATLSNDVDEIKLSEGLFKSYLHQMSQDIAVLAKKFKFKPPLLDRIKNAISKSDKKLSKMEKLHETLRQNLGNESIEVESIKNKNVDFRRKNK